MRLSRTVGFGVTLEVGIDYASGECKRLLRQAGMFANDRRKSSAKLKSAQRAARSAWRLALKLEAKDAAKPRTVETATDRCAIEVRDGVVYENDVIIGSVREVNFVAIAPRASGAQCPSLTIATNNRSERKD